MNIYSGGRFTLGVPIALRTAMGHRLFSLSLLDVLITRCTGKSNGSPVRLRRPRLRATTAGLGLTRLATTFMNNLG